RSRADARRRRPHHDARHVARPGERRRGGVVNIDDIAAALAARLPGRVERRVSSAALTTYRCGGPLAVVVRAEQEDDLSVIAGVIGDDVPMLVIGRGSNLLVADGGFAGVAVTLAGEFEQLDIE